jgi:hypothetical protein
MDKRIGVVLLNWNGAEFTVPCLQSIFASVRRPWKIVVVDNVSTDGSPDLLESSFPTVTILRNPRNLGFAGGNNVGIRHLLAEADLVWILNNDTEVHPQCLGMLVAQLDADPGLAAVSGKILFASPPDRIWYTGAQWRWWSLTASHRGAMEQDVGQYNIPGDVGFISGCCMLVRAVDLKQVGALDERYFVYDEDAEWCLRALKAGLKLAVPSYAQAVERPRDSAEAIEYVSDVLKDELTGGCPIASSQFPLLQDTIRQPNRS